LLLRIYVILYPVILFGGHDFDNENILGRFYLHPMRDGQWRNRPMTEKVFMRNAQLRGKVIYRGQPKV
jgi:hypothetical protein